jgi:hypothetical protein
MITLPPFLFLLPSVTFLLNFYVSMRQSRSWNTTKILHFGFDGQRDLFFFFFDFYLSSLSTICFISCDFFFFNWIYSLTHFNTRYDPDPQIYLVGAQFQPDDVNGGWNLLFLPPVS